ncbi:MAG: S-layer homology domain-containing protein [Ruminococcus sp.]|nr:S-layer homology domain-containing protein [Ruminococcus sp.]
MKKLRFTAILAAIMLSAGVISASADEVIADETDAYSGYSVYVPSSYGGSGGSSSDVSDVDLQTALTKVKRRVDVPAVLSEFEYRVNTLGGITTFNFTWTPKDSTVTPEPLKVGSTVPTYLNVTIVGDTITDIRYNENKVYGGDGSEPRQLGKINPEDYETYAKRAIKLANPGMEEKVEVGVMNASLYGESVNCYFVRVENGIRVASNSGTVSFDKDTGKLYSFHVTWWDNAQFTAPSSRLNTSNIQKKYESAIKLNPAYIIKKDYQKNTITAEIVYTPSDNYEFDAFTGKKTTMYDDISKYNDSVNIDIPSANYGFDVAESAAGMAYDDEVLNDEAVAFTAAERREIEESKVRYTKEDAVKIVAADPYITYNDKYKLTSANLYSSTDFGKEKNTWRLQFVLDDDKKSGNISVTLDADTGKIEQFTQSGDNVGAVDYPVYEYEDVILVEEGTDNGDAKEKTPMFDVAKSVKLAEEAAKYYFGNSFNEYRGVSANTKPLTKDTKTGKTINIYAREFVYNRYHENIPVNGESVRVTVNAYGEIRSISQNHTEVIFPKADILTSAEAFEELWKQTKFSLYYAGFTADGTPHTYLMYNLPSYYMNARTGKLSDYYGKAIPKSDTDERYEYSDLKTDGSGFAERIAELGYYGIQLEPIDGKFAPQTEITGKEFYNLLRNYTGGYYNSDAIFGIDKSEKSVTYRDAAKLFTTMSNLGAAAKLEGIYAQVFTDIPVSDPDIGYINIADALGLRFLDGNAFKPDNKVTRAEAINMFYRFVAYGE